jgi:hypothetical protein
MIPFHLRWQIATIQLVGMILYTGEKPASFGENLWALPFGFLRSYREREIKEESIRSHCSSIPMGR